MSTIEHCIQWAKKSLPAEQQEKAVDALLRLYWTDEERWGNYGWRDMLNLLERGPL